MASNIHYDSFVHILHYEFSRNIIEFIHISYESSHFVFEEKVS